MKYLGGIFAIAMLSPAISAHAQSEPDYAKMFGEFVAKTDDHIVEIYTEEIAKIKGNAALTEALRTRFYEDLSTLGTCAIQRGVLYDTLDQSRYLEDAVRLRQHYDFFAQALERHGIATAQEAEAAYYRDKETIENQIRADYAKAISGEDSAKKQEMDVFFKRCNEAAVVTDNIDAAALKRNSGGK